MIFEGMLQSRHRLKGLSRSAPIPSLELVYRCAVDADSTGPGASTNFLV
jgi:hypothetical protein